jgi:hypothetical protein
MRSFDRCDDVVVMWQFVEKRAPVFDRDAIAGGGW